MGLEPISLAWKAKAQTSIPIPQKHYVDLLIKISFNGQGSNLLHVKPTVVIIIH